MAKHKNDDPITAKDLEQFVASTADFTFEMRVLAQLEAGFNCEHGGTYRDPVTGKSRQFDVRARRTIGQLHVSIAVESKNVGANFPILVHAVPRKQAEAFHSLIIYVDQPFPREAMVKGIESVYRPGEFVGKRIDQVGHAPGGDLIGGDQAAFEKISQSVNGTFDLVHEAVFSSEKPAVHVIIPMLVLPDGRLWQVDYSENGERLGSPRQVKSSTLFLDQEWSVEAGLAGYLSYRVSHLQITTLGALEDALIQLIQRVVRGSPMLFGNMRV